MGKKKLKQSVDYNELTMLKTNLDAVYRKTR